MIDISYLYKKGGIAPLEPPTFVKVIQTELRAGYARSFNFVFVVFFLKRPCFCCLFLKKTRDIIIIINL